MSADAAVRAMIDSLRELSNFGERAAPDVALAVRGELESTIAREQSPDGEPWEKRKSGSGQLLPNATSRLYVAAVGSVVYIRLKGNEARHHRGRARGGAVRRVIPYGPTLPDPIAIAIRNTLDKHFEQITGGGNG